MSRQTGTCTSYVVLKANKYVCTLEAFTNEPMRYLSLHCSFPINHGLMEVTNVIHVGSLVLFVLCITVSGGLKKLLVGRTVNLLYFLKEMKIFHRACLWNNSANLCCKQVPFHINWNFEQTFVFFFIVCCNFLVLWPCLLL